MSEPVSSNKATKSYLCKYCGWEGYPATWWKNGQGPWCPACGRSVYIPLSAKERQEIDERFKNEWQ